MNDQKLSRIALGILLAAALGTGGYLYVKNRPAPEEPSPAGGETGPAGEEEEAAFRVLWAKDPGTRIEGGSVPYIRQLSSGSYRLYYCGPGGILSAVSADGLAFTKEAGVRIAGSGGAESIVCDPTVVELSDGRVRMYYKGADRDGGPGTAKHRIFSAVSADGLAFTKEGMRIDPDETGDGGWASVPEAIKLTDGRVRIYYVSADPAINNGIASAISNDGLNFSKEAGARVQDLVDPAILRLADGRYLLLAANPGGPAGGQSVPPGIYSFLSDDGLTFTNRQAVTSESGALDPTVIYLSDQTLRVYFGKIPAEGGEPSTESATGTVE